VIKDAANPGGQTAVGLVDHARDYKDRNWQDRCDGSGVIRRVCKEAQLVRIQPLRKR
jgi:hypothetical protein